MDKQLPMINEEPVVQEYMKILFQNDKKKEYKNTEELLQYIAGMEKQFEDILKELHDVKELLNDLQNPSTKSRLTNVVDKTQMTINNGKDRLQQVKINLLSSMKDCLESFKQKGKDRVIKTVNVLHFKEALRGVQSSLYKATFKMKDVVSICDMITSEMRNSQRHFKNIGLLMMGKPVKRENNDTSKLNIIQKSTRSLVEKLYFMNVKTGQLLDKLESFEKPSIKDEIKLLRNTTKSSTTKTDKKMEQSR